jgi:chemotaxis protein methyltransferase CheR
MLKSKLSLDVLEITPKEFKLFKDLMYSKAGIKFGECKKALIQNRLRKRLRILSLTNYLEYYNYIIDPKHESEFQECLNALTTNETYFFRHKNHWDFFTQVFVPSVLRRRNGGKIVRVWSAAASTGAEAYSAAIALYELLPPPDGWQIQIDATDINAEVLESAKQAIYDSYALQKMTKGCVNKYMEKVGDRNNWRVISSVRKLVKFQPHNLLDEKRGGAYDFVFLRNVMIYFDEVSKARVLKNIADKIKPGGYLVLGGAESLSSCQKKFKYIKPTIYQKIK